MWKSLLLSALFGVAVYAACYLFFRAHQELEIEPARCWQIAALAFVVSLVVSLVYFRVRPGR